MTEMTILWLLPQDKWISFLLRGNSTFLAISTDETLLISVYKLCFDEVYCDSEIRNYPDRINLANQSQVGLNCCINTFLISRLSTMVFFNQTKADIPNSKSYAAA
jgi:hypothetical protein